MTGVLQWDHVTVASGAKKLLDDVSGHARPGTVTALMGPSGSGKTTLLSVLAQRTGAFGKFDITGDVVFGEDKVTSSFLRGVSRFVEQEDHLLGCLTVKELIDFSIQMLEKMASEDRKRLVENTINFFGLTKQQNTIVGTPIQKGLSGGQKRRLSVACQVVTRPTILFLDEPTSGLDSTASHEVVRTIKEFAQRENVVVIASIHQPRTLTFDLFDNVVFLAEGKVAYAGERANVGLYFDKAGFAIPPHYNPAEYILDLINTDFKRDATTCSEDSGEAQTSALDTLVAFARDTGGPSELISAGQYAEKTEEGEDKSPFQSAAGSASVSVHGDEPSFFSKTLALFYRGMVKARRDYLAYYVRLAMYLGLAIMMATVWVRLKYTQENILSFTTAIFFSGAFMSFMSVAYIPAYLEDYFSYKKERANGLYGPFSFVLANFFIGVPFLFLIVAVFSLITYFTCHFVMTPGRFFMYVVYLFVNLLAAESLTILIASIFPVFVVALALTAFANGLWMAVGGFLVSASVLNDFWYYTFYWIDYQRYAFQGMMFNQFKDTVFECGKGCQCMYASELQDQCLIKGDAVLEALGYSTANHGLWIGIMLVLTFVLRFGTYLALKLRK